MPKNKGNIRFLLWGGFLLIPLLLLLWFFLGNPSQEAAATAQHIVRPRFITMQQTVRATGIVRAQIGAKVRVGARISGLVMRLNANIGDFVRQGQIIAQLDTAELNAKIAQARARLQQARAQLALIRRGARREFILMAQAASQRTKAILDNAHLEYRRLQRLFANRLISKDKLDRARRNWQIAQANHLQALAQLKWKKHRYLPEERRLARAKVALAKANLDLAKIKASYATIRAPISGVIASVSTQKGETISAGFRAPTFVTIIDLNRLQVETFVDEVDIGKVKVGQKATFQVDAYPSRDFEGTVSAIYPNAVIQANVVNYVVVISLNNQSKLLRTGMTANVTLNCGRGKKILALPRRAIRRKGRQRFVLLKGSDGQIRKQKIRIGRRKGRYIEIKSGLSPRARVLMSTSQSP